MPQVICSKMALKKKKSLRRRWSKKRGLLQSQHARICFITLILDQGKIFKDIENICWWLLSIGTNCHKMEENCFAVFTAVFFCKQRVAAPLPLGERGRWHCSFSERPWEGTQAAQSLQTPREESPHLRGTGGKNSLPRNTLGTLKSFLQPKKPLKNCWMTVALHPAVSEGRLISDPLFCLFQFWLCSTTICFTLYSNKASKP